VLPLSLMPQEYRRCELNAVTSRYKREAVIPDGRRLKVAGGRLELTNTPAYEAG
jgi:hypothetical protein